MGIVKISDLMHENLRVASNALSRSINAQAEHWMRIGMLAELHPELELRELSRLLIQAELAGGLDIHAAAERPSAAAAETAASKARPKANAKAASASAGQH